ncbi:MAG TPA: DUF2079 domain-containing protein [Chloroflexota bacterium]
MAPVALAAMVAGYALLFGWMSLERYWAYAMHALDMGNMGQAAWNTLHGHPFAFTNMRLPYHQIEAWGTTTRLSFHVEALFPLISLVYLPNQHPESLLILQTVGLAIGAIPTYLLARDVLQNAGLALVFALAYLLFPTVEAMNLYEFHPVALATPLLLFAFLFAHRRQYTPFVLCCLAAMGTKEEIGLIVCMFGLYVAFIQGERRVGLGLAAVGIGWSLFATLVIEKHFRQPGAMSYVTSRYGYLCGGADATGQVHCHGLHGPIHTVLHDPGAIGRALFVWPKFGYLRYLLAPVGFTALLAPVALLLAAPTLLLNLLSQDIHMYSGVGDNSAEIASVVVIAGILGSRRLRDFLARRTSARRASVLLGVYILVLGVWNQHINGFTPIGNAYQLPPVGAHQRLESRFVSMVPPSVPISTQDQLDPHLSSRRYLYLFEDTGARVFPGAPNANYVLLDVSAPTYPLPSYQLHDRALNLLQRGWGVAAADDGLILLKNGLRQKTPPASFYDYALAGGDSIGHQLTGGNGGLRVLGYNVERTDLPNHRIPVLAYTVYLQLTRHLSADMEPVLYETMGSSLIGCSAQPLGLAWYPTTRWRSGKRYKVNLEPLETTWQSPGTAQLQLELRPVTAQVAGQPVSCSWLWNQHLQHHSRLWPAGTIGIDF